MGALCEIHGDRDIRGNTCPGHIRDHATQFGDACYVQRRGDGNTYEDCEDVCADSDGKVACPSNQKTMDWLDDKFNMRDVGDRWIDPSCQSSLDDSKCYLMDHGAHEKSATAYRSECGEGDTDECICQLTLTEASDEFVKVADRDGGGDDSSSRGGVMIVAIVVGVCVVLVAVATGLVWLRMKSVADEPLEGLPVSEMVEVTATVAQ